MRKSLLLTVAAFLVMAMGAIPALAAGCNGSDDGGGTPAAQTTTETDGEGGDADDEFNMLVLDELGIVDVAVVYPRPGTAEPGVASQSERFDQPVPPAVAARDYICGIVPEGGELTYLFDSPNPPNDATERIQRFEELARATFCPE